MTSRAPSRPRAVSERSAVPRISRNAASSDGSSGSGPSPGTGAPPAKKYSSSAVNAITRSGSSRRRSMKRGAYVSLSPSRQVPSMWKRSLVCRAPVSRREQQHLQLQQPVLDAVDGEALEAQRRRSAGDFGHLLLLDAELGEVGRAVLERRRRRVLELERRAHAIGADQQVHAEPGHVRRDEDAQAVRRLVRLPAVRQLDLERRERRQLGARVREPRAQNSTRSEKYHSAAAPTPAPASTNAAST